MVRPGLGSRFRTRNLVEGGIRFEVRSRDYNLFLDIYQIMVYGEILEK